MKNEKDRSRRIRVTAAVCAMVIVAGGAAGIYSFRNSDEAGTVPDKSAAVNAVAASDDSIISAGGTITSAQLSDTLGLKDTSVRLTVEEVLISSGDTVTAETPLYSITSDSLAKAEKTLRSELQSANSALLEEKISYQTDKNEAYLLYQSELLLGDTAKNEYDSGMSSLDSELKEADASYKEALNTVNSTPSQISAKKSEMNSKQASADSLQSCKDQLQQEVNEAKSAYDQAAERYNRVTAEYNAAAGVVRYLGNALGRDISDIVLAQTVSAVKEERSSVPAEGGDSRPDGEGVPDMSGMPQDGRSFRATSFYSEAVSSEEEETPEISAEEIAANALNEGLETMYSTALEDYSSKKEELSRAEEEMKNTESDYRAKSDSLTECSSELKEAQSSVTSISKEISELESALSKAKSNLSRLRSEYNSLNASYTTDQLELKNKLDTDTASYENAEYHYQITLSTIEDELSAAQEAYDTAEENLRIYEESLTDGYINAEQDGIIYSLSCQEGRSVNISTPYVYYVDESGFSTVVELDQNDITQVSIGDSVMIYSSETGMAKGRITAIAAGESTSLADVRFNVTVAADEGADLYSGETVNVYFNYGNMKSGDFSDFKGETGSDGGKRSFSGERPDFGGSMPEGFDPSDMAGFSRRKDD